ncbi:MAG: PilZ domain-containing protein [Nitrosomonadales bacterium]|nr:MAG: PilZ domain-containing protein [Nitrosomonadales bacterium]
MFWPAAIYSVDPANSAAILHGTTCEVSKNGAAILSDKNILLESITPAVMQMTIPPFSLGQQAKTIEFPCCMVYSYLSSRHSKFKVGVDFLELSKDSKVLLDQALSVARSFISVAT